MRSQPLGSPLPSAASPSGLSSTPFEAASADSLAAAPPSDLPSGGTTSAVGPRSEPVLTRHRRPLSALTGLRFFAAFYVVLVHTRVSSSLIEKGHRVAGDFVHNGILAVPLFFLLSGFILSYTYRGQIKSSRDRTHFWQARFARIWPAYAFSLLCVSLPSFDHPPPGLAVATLFMVQAWNPFHPEFAGAWNLVCWTLSVEAFFYLCFPALQALLERLQPSRVALVGGLSLLASVLANTGERTLGSPTYAPPFELIPLPLIHLPVFLVGVALGNLFLQRERLGERASRKRSLALLTTLGVLCSGAALCLPTGRFTSLVLPGFALLVYGLAAEPSPLARLLSTRALLIGGGVSYSIYLLQTPVRLWVRDIPALNGGSGLLPLLYVPGILLVLATLTFFLLEEPARRLLRRLFARLSRPAPAAASPTA